MNTVDALRRVPVTFLLGLLACMTGRPTQAISDANPYQAIVERNVFGLKPIPPPLAPEPEHTPPPKITLTGITTILGNKDVLMKVQMPIKPGEKPNEQSFILAEGQHEGDIRVLAVNVETGDVTIDDFGTVVTLNLDKDGAKLSSTPLLAGAPGPPPPLGIVPTPFEPRPARGPLPPPSPAARSLRPPPAAAPQPGADSGRSASSSLVRTPGSTGGPAQLVPSVFWLVAILGPAGERGKSGFSTLIVAGKLPTDAKASK